MIRFLQKNATKKLINHYKNQFIDSGEKETKPFFNPFKKLWEREINYYYKKAVDDLRAGKIIKNK